MPEFILLSDARLYYANACCTICRFTDGNVRTICNGVIETDSIASVAINRINTLAICEMTKEVEWNILSINIDEEISKPF